MEELRECPCGNEAHLIFEEGTKVADPWSVACKNFDCPWVFQTFPTKEEAVKHWNTRAADETIRVLVEALEWISEDGHAIASMTIGSRDRLCKALAQARKHLGE